MSSHFAQSWQYSIHVLIGIHESDNHRKLTANFHQMCRTHSAASLKSGHGMQCDAPGYVLFPQIFEYF